MKFLSLYGAVIWLRGALFMPYFTKRFVHKIIVPLVVCLLLGISEILITDQNDTVLSSDLVPRLPE